MGEVTMFYRTIFVCFVGSILVKLVKTDSQKFTEITFTIESKKNLNNVPHLSCDHSDERKQNNTYTVLEGEEFKIITNHTSLTNFFICRNYHDIKTTYEYIEPKLSKLKTQTIVTFIAKKDMGTIWNCMVLSNRDLSVVNPEIQYKDHTYSAAYCFMQIHVRQANPPQTILVNNMALQAVRTDLSEKKVDFNAEYQYVDGDEVTVACINFLGTATLTMEYPMADKLSDKFSSKDLTSSQVISFSTKLHSQHNNSSMICTATENTDYTKVMVRFVMRTEINIVSIKINGWTLRPKVYNKPNHTYRIEYKYIKNIPIKVMCEVERADVKLVVADTLDFAGKVKGYRKTELKPTKQSEMWFYLNGQNKQLACGSGYLIGGVAEIVTIIFSEGKFPTEVYPLQMEFPPNGTVMALYDYSEFKPRNVVFHEFENGERLRLKCGPLQTHQPGPILYLQFKDSSCRDNGCYVPQSLTVTDQQDDNSEIVCQLMEEEAERGKRDKVVREIRVILRKTVLTTTTTTTTTTTSTTTTVQSTDPADPGQSPSQEQGTSDPSSNPSIPAMIAGAVVCIIIICVSTVIIKLRKRNHSQGGPHDRNYENLATPSETSTPAFPPQWESNYAVPVDRRTDDTTYSVPCREPALYSTPTPKNLRNKKQKPVEPTYAVLNVPNAQGRKNVFKETDDPNYSEVYANRQEQCYAKVLPKSARNKMVEDNNPYSYVTNEPEPMYCEPAKAAYANLNNSHYANSNAQEYVEPTYCEPQKLSK